MRHLFPVSLLWPLLLSCSASNATGDMELISIEVVDYNNRAEMPTPSAAALVGLLTEEEMERAGLTSPGEERPHRLLLMAEFVSEVNLADLARETGYTIASFAYFCDRPLDHVILSIPDVYWEGKRVGEFASVAILQTDGRSDPSFTYYTFLNVARDPIVPSKPPQVGFDLQQEPEDICFYVSGGRGSGPGYRSNTTTIPKDAIAAALQRLPPGFDVGRANEGPER